MSQREYIYGVAFNINDYGVIITGDSGVGKSDLALKLIDRGHKFICDDQIEVSLIDNSLYINSHEKLSGFLYVRNIGFINILTTYNKERYLPSSPLNLIINLTKKNIKKKTLPTLTSQIILNRQIPTANINLTNNRPLELLIELVVKYSQQIDNGYDSNQDFISKQQELIHATNTS